MEFVKNSIENSLTEVIYEMRKVVDFPTGTSKFNFLICPFDLTASAGKTVGRLWNE